MAARRVSGTGGGRMALAAAAALLAAGCSVDAQPGGGGAEAVGTAQSHLSGAQMSQVLGMEDPTLWHSTTAALSSSPIHTQGQTSLAVKGTNFNFIDSIPLTSFQLTSNVVQFSIRLPTQQPNPFWFGDVQMYVNAPSVGLFNQYVGIVGLTGRPLNQFTTITMTLPQNIVQGLAGPFTDLVIRLVLNVPSNATGTYLFDDLRFGGVSAPTLAGFGPVDMTVEPTESNNIVYLPLAPHFDGGPSVGQFTLDIAFLNTGTSTATVDTVTVSFAGGPAVPPRTYNLATAASPTGLVIAAGDTQHFLFGHDQTILLPQPAPTSVTIQAHTVGFSSPVTMTRPLVAHVSPVEGGAWTWPGLAADLPAGQFWQGASTFHNPGIGQGFAMDLGVVRFDTTLNDWTDVREGAAGTQNEDFLIWGMPIHAMGDGVVAQFSDDFPANPGLGFDNTYQNAVCNVNPAAPHCPVPLEGNAFFIQSGPELMLYAHLQAGTLNPALKVVGAQVHRGDFLGLSGNAGNSSGPHLHIHTARTTVANGGTLRPMPFQNVWMIDRSLDTPPSASAPWGFVQGKGVPEVTSLIFPGATRPSFP